MRRLACVAAAVLAAAFLFDSGVAAGTAGDSARAVFAGRYLVSGNATKTIVITPVARGAYSLVATDWEGVGLFDGTNYWGVFRHGRSASLPLVGASGTHLGTLRPDGSLAVHGEYTSGHQEPFEVVWTPEHKGAPPGRPGPPVRRPENRDSLRVTPPEPGEPGDYVYVEELPEAVRKVPPSYPQAARDAKIQGTVMTQVLVGEDGLVKEAKIVKGIPGLDEAALEAVRQWVFKPALSRGKPVAVRVAVPIRFSLH